MLKKIFTIFFAFTLFFAVSPLFMNVFAQTQSKPDEILSFEEFDPLVIGQDGGSTAKNSLSTPGEIITRVLQYAIPLAGLILFVMITWGGFEMLTSSIGAKKDAGKQRVQSALIGFFLLFSTYWIAQIVEVVFGVRILN